MARRLRRKEFDWSCETYITLHDEDIIHPLKEVDGAAMAWATTPSQVVEILSYVISAK